MGITTTTTPLPPAEVERLIDLLHQGGVSTEQLVSRFKQKHDTDVRRVTNKLDAATVFSNANAHANGVTNADWRQALSDWTEVYCAKNPDSVDYWCSFFASNGSPISVQIRWPNEYPPLDCIQLDAYLDDWDADSPNDGLFTNVDNWWGAAVIAFDDPESPNNPTEADKAETRRLLNLT